MIFDLWDVFDITKSQYFHDLFLKFMRCYVSSFLSMMSLVQLAWLIIRDINFRELISMCSLIRKSITKHYNTIYILKIDIIAYTICIYFYLTLHLWLMLTFISLNFRMVCDCCFLSKYYICWHFILFFVLKKKQQQNTSKWKYNFHLESII